MRIQGDLFTLISEYRCRAFNIHNTDSVVYFCYAAVLPQNASGSPRNRTSQSSEIVAIYPSNGAKLDTEKSLKGFRTKSNWKRERCAGVCHNNGIKNTCLPTPLFFYRLPYEIYVYKRGWNGKYFGELATVKGDRRDYRI